MSLYLAKNQKGYYILRENVWVPGEDDRPGAVRQRYIGYVGKEPKLTRSKALKICAEKGIDLEALQAVRGLTIVDDPED
jgi:hypothetical protein